MADRFSSSRSYTKIAPWRGWWINLERCVLFLLAALAGISGGRQHGFAVANMEESRGGGTVMLAIVPHHLGNNDESRRSRLLLAENTALGLGNVTHSQCGPYARGVKRFYDMATSLQEPVTDKVTTHVYELMYGMFLGSMVHHRHVKLLEIGLGCGMRYGAGASVPVWKKFLPQSLELWEAEYDRDCVASHLSDGSLDGVHTLLGDQNDVPTLDQWIELSGGHFDVIVDDGGHRPEQIKASFDRLWPSLKDGGFYFMEDLQVARHKNYYLPEIPTMPDIIKDWIDQLLMCEGCCGADNNPKQYDHPLPPDIAFITCMHEACVIAKTNDRTRRREACWNPPTGNLKK